jgi:outer membrane cobalamin receptor
MTMKKTAMAIAIATAVTPVLAEEQGQKDVVVVYGTRTASEQVRDTYSIGYLGVTTNTTDIYDLANTGTGINVVRSGPRGQMTSTFMRGADSDQVGLALNGVSIIDEATPNSGLNLGVHSMTGLTSVEVIKGPVSALYGSNAVAGVVNLNSTPTLDTYVQQSIGSNGLSYTKAKFGKLVNDGKTIVSGEVYSEKRDGPSVYALGTESDPFKSTGFSVSQETTLDSGWSVYTGLISNTNDVAYDASSADADYNADEKFQNIQVALSNDSTRLVYNRAKHDRDYVEVYDATAWAPAGVRDGTYNSDVTTYQGEHTLKLSESFSLTLGGERKEIAADFKSLYGDRLDKTRDINSLYSTLSYSVTKDVVVTGTMRKDDSSDFGGYDSTRLAVGAYGFRASVSDGYRLPSMYEMHGQGALLTGNPNVKPETSKAYEIGYGNEWMDVALFDIKTNSSINADYTAGTYKNSDGTESAKGVEAKVFGNIGNVKLSNATTYTQSKDSLGKDRLRRPEWKNTLMVEAKFGETIVGAAHNYYGKSYDTKWPSTIEIAPVSTLDLSIKRDFGKVEVSAVAANVTDKVYERPYGYTQPGRNFMLTAKYKF